MDFQNKLDVDVNIDMDIDVVPLEQDNIEPDDNYFTIVNKLKENINVTLEIERFIKKYFDNVINTPTQFIIKLNVNASCRISYLIIEKKNKLTYYYLCKDNTKYINIIMSIIKFAFETKLQQENYEENESINNKTIFNDFFEICSNINYFTYLINFGDENYYKNIEQIVDLINKLEQYQYMLISRNDYVFILINLSINKFLIIDSNLPFHGIIKKNKIIEYLLCEDKFNGILTIGIEITKIKSDSLKKNDFENKIHKKDTMNNNNNDDDINYNDINEYIDLYDTVRVPTQFAIKNNVNMCCGIGYLVIKYSIYLLTYYLEKKYNDYAKLFWEIIYMASERKLSNPEIKIEGEYLDEITIKNDFSEICSNMDYYEFIIGEFCEDSDYNLQQILNYISKLPKHKPMILCRNVNVFVIFNLTNDEFLVIDSHIRVHGKIQLNKIINYITCDGNFNGIITIGFDKFTETNISN